MKKLIVLFTLLFGTAAEACPPVNVSYSLAYPIQATAFYVQAPQIISYVVGSCPAPAVSLPNPPVSYQSYATEVTTPPVTYGVGQYSTYSAPYGAGYGIGASYGGFGYGFGRSFYGSRYPTSLYGGFNNGIFLNRGFRRGFGGVSVAAPGVAVNVGGFRRGFSSSVAVGTGIPGGVAVVNTSERRGLFGRVRARDTQVIQAGGGGVSVVNQRFGRGFRR